MMHEKPVLCRASVLLCVLRIKSRTLRKALLSTHHTTNPLVVVNPLRMHLTNSYLFAERSEMMTVKVLAISETGSEFPMRSYQSPTACWARPVSCQHAPQNTGSTRAGVSLFEQLNWSNPTQIPLHELPALCLRRSLPNKAAPPVLTCCIL